MNQDPKIGIIRVELNHITKGTARIFDRTIRVYRDAVSFLVHAASEHASEVYDLSSYDETTFMDRLVHQTKDNPFPEYPTFDLLFNRLPSYMRRAASHSACGYIRSHHSNCENYQADRSYHISRGHHYTKRAPGFTYTPNVCPVLYRDQT